MKSSDSTISITGPGGEVLLPPMPADEFSKLAARASSADFALEAETPGEIPARVIEELRHFRAVAKDHAQAFSDACKAQAEKHKIPAAALKRYIGALEDDTIDKLDDEARALERLLDQ